MNLDEISPAEHGPVVDGSHSDTKPPSTKDRGNTGPPEEFRKRRRFLRWMFLLGIIVSLCIGCFVYGLMVAQEINQRFSSLRWESASRIYTDSLSLKAGIYLPRKVVLQRLRALGYALRQKVESPGQYSLAGRGMEIWLRVSPDGAGQGAVKVYWGGKRIERVTTLDGRILPAGVDLPPRLLAAVMGKTGELRTLVRLQDVPEDLLHAVLATEDVRFFQHHGLDLVSLLRATWTNLKHRRVVQGGSTISQQLVKNFFLSPERTFARKFREAVMTVMLEYLYSKDEILEMYLNEIYLGQMGKAEIRGMAEAAEYYFDRNVRNLSLAECALLAGMIRAPNGYSPFRNPQRALKRRNVVLGLMARYGFITEAQKRAAQAAPLRLRERGNRIFRAPYFLDEVKRELLERYSLERLGTAGLTIRTTLNTRLQMLAEESLRQGLEQLEQALRRRRKAAKKEKLQGAMVVMNPHTGAILALVGGRDEVYGGFNRTVKAKRQPGSAFKPFVYLAAMDRYSPSSFVMDVPKAYGKGRKRWIPKNYDRRYHGRVTLRRALEKSYNAATVNLGMRLGLAKVIAVARSAGIRSILRPYPSLLIGACEVTPMELAAAYCVFANGGYRVTPTAVKLVTRGGGGIVNRVMPVRSRVTSAEKAYLVTNMLQGVIARGTARVLLSRGLGVNMAGKTGTTSDYRDAWFVGYTPDLLALVWVGYDDGRSIGFSASRSALLIWGRFMRAAYEGMKPKPFSVPTGIVSRKICCETGQLATLFCPCTREEVFLAGSEPDKKCRKHSLGAKVRRFLDRILPKR